MKTFLSFGAGVDSTTILAMLLDREGAARQLGISLAELNAALPLIDGAIFSDPGAEFPATYKNVEVARQLCTRQNLRFEVVRKEGLTITQWLQNNGNVPVMPGGKHVCSLKFKGEVLQKWAATEYPGASYLWLVGIEADEGHRTARFSPPANSNHAFAYPLVDLGMNRAACVDMLKALNWPVPVEKSSCVFCPFMSQAEIANLYQNHPDLWAQVRQIEDHFRATSKIKHAAWIDAGKPRTGKTGTGPAPKGMWSKDAWREGARLFSKSFGGSRRSVPEWEQIIEDQGKQYALAV